MSEYIAPEGNLQFDFTYCGKPIKFDEANNSGLYAVDFVVDKDDYLLFIEVKDYQNPNAPKEQQCNDIKMLLDASKSKKSLFAIEMGCKIKDSLLSYYVKGELLTKNIIYLLLINLDRLSPQDRRLLYQKTCGFIPYGLNNKDRFPAFKEIKFKIVSADGLKRYGIACEAIS